MKHDLPRLRKLLWRYMRNRSANNQQAFMALCILSYGEGTLGNRFIGACRFIRKVAP